MQVVVLKLSGFAFAIYAREGNWVYKWGREGRSSR